MTRRKSDPRMKAELGNRIRDARKASGLSQSALARAVGAHVTTVSGWERGKTSPTPENLDRIVAATGQDGGYFSQGSEGIASDVSTGRTKADDREAIDLSGWVLEIQAGYLRPRRSGR